MRRVAKAFRNAAESQGEKCSPVARAYSWSLGLC